MDNQIATASAASTTALDRIWVGFVIVAGIIGVLMTYGAIAWVIHQFAGGVGVALFMVLVVFAVCFMAAARKYGRRNRP